VFYTECTGAIMKKALIVVDIQNDFCPGGTLAVKDGDSIIRFVNAMMFKNNYEVVVANLDWHPQNHKSFAKNNDGALEFSVGTLGGKEQTMWPVHCVQGTPGAALHASLDERLIDKKIYKGTNPEVDSYSGFCDNDQKTSTGLERYLRDNEITSVEIVGLALDYCVKATALDAVRLGFQTRVLLEGTKAVCLNPGDDMAAIEYLRQHKVEVR
jgi:nicotinamidase/pyrazinamidase